MTSSKTKLTWKHNHRKRLNLENPGPTLIIFLLHKFSQAKSFKCLEWWVSRGCEWGSDCWLQTVTVVLTQFHSLTTDYIPGTVLSTWRNLALWYLAPDCTCALVTIAPLLYAATYYGLLRFKQVQWLSGTAMVELHGPDALHHAIWSRGCEDHHSRQQVSSCLWKLGVSYSVLQTSLQVPWGGLGLLRVPRKVEATKRSGEQETPAFLTLKKISGTSSQPGTERVNLKLPLWWMVIILSM